VDGDGVFGSIEADGGSVASNLAFGDIVGSLGAEKEAVATKNSVSDEGGSLLTIKLRERKEYLNENFQGLTLNTSRTARVWRPDCL
jgi:hypothetical protein